VLISMQNNSNKLSSCKVLDLVVFSRGLIGILCNVKVLGRGIGLDQGT